MLDSVRPFTVKSLNGLGVRPYLHQVAHGLGFTALQKALKKSAGVRLLQILYALPAIG